VATWGQVTLLLNTMYDVLEDSTESIDVQVATGQGRSQVVTVRAVQPSDDSGGAWVVVESPIGRLEDVDCMTALELAEDLLVGGLGKRQEFLTVVHVAPLATLDAPDLARPLELLARAADRLERALVGEDYL
jgi:hypothetical protein